MLHAAVVEVNVRTGAVDILRYVVIEDCGTAVNPTIVEGQLHGGIAQGIGQTLYEHAVLGYSYPKDGHDFPVVDYGGAEREPDGTG